MRKKKIIKSMIRTWVRYINSSVFIFQKAAATWISCKIEKFVFQEETPFHLPERTLKSSPKKKKKNQQLDAYIILNMIGNKGGFDLNRLNLDCCLAWFKPSALSHWNSPHGWFFFFFYGNSFFSPMIWTNWAYVELIILDLRWAWIGFCSDWNWQKSTRQLES